MPACAKASAELHICHSGSGGICADVNEDSLAQEPDLLNLFFIKSSPDNIPQIGAYIAGPYKHAFHINFPPFVYVIPKLTPFFGIWYMMVIASLPTAVSYLLKKQR